MAKTAMKSARRRAQIGDIVEIPTAVGFGYVQYTHDAGESGELVRVLPGLYATRPSDLEQLARLKEVYFVFYTLQYALNTRKAFVISNQPVPADWQRAHPMMRHCASFDKTGKVTHWRFVSAASKLHWQELAKYSVVSELTPEQEKLSVYMLSPHPALVRQFERGWIPERYEEFERIDIAERMRKEDRGSDKSSADSMSHFLYFARKKDAEGAGKFLREGGFFVEVSKGEGEEKWLVLTKRASPNNGEQMEDLRNDLEKLASRFGGEYDGWEMAVEPVDLDLIGPPETVN